MAVEGSTRGRGSPRRGEDEAGAAEVGLALRGGGLRKGASGRPGRTGLAQRIRVAAGPRPGQLEIRRLEEEGGERRSVKLRERVEANGGAGNCGQRHVPLETPERHAFWRLPPPVINQRICDGLEGAAAGTKDRKRDCTP